VPCINIFCTRHPNTPHTPVLSVTCTLHSPESAYSLPLSRSHSPLAPPRAQPHHHSHLTSHAPSPQSTALNSPYLQKGSKLLNKERGSAIDVSPCWGALVCSLWWRSAQRCWHFVDRGIARGVLWGCVGRGFVGREGRRGGERGVCYQKFVSCLFTMYAFSPQLEVCTCSWIQCNKTTRKCAHSMKTATSEARFRHILILNIFTSY
jgi:hypothetical protein